MRWGGERERERLGGAQAGLLSRDRGSGRAPPGVEGERQKRVAKAHVLAAPDEGAVALHEAKVLVDVDAAELHHRRQLGRKGLPPRRKLLALVGPVVVELDQPRVRRLLDQIAIGLGANPDGGGKDGRRLAAAAAAAKRLEELFLLAARLLLLLLLLLNT
jgi:hypothetical protein